MNRSNAMDIQTNEPQQRMVSPWEALKYFFTRLTPRGRSSRSEVWWVMLFVYGPLSVIARCIPRTTLGFLLVALLHLLFSWPWFCLLARRLHDLDRHMGWAIAGLVVGWLGWLFVAAPMQMMGLMLVGLVIAGVLLVVSCARSKMCPNKYGDIPNLIGTRGEVSHGAETRAVPLSSVHNFSVMVCPSCGKELRVPATCLGMECECPYCGEIIVVEGEVGASRNGQPAEKSPSRILPVALVVGIALVVLVAVISVVVSNRFTVINADGRVCRLDRWTGRTELLRGNRWVETVEAETKQKTTGVVANPVQVEQSVQPVKKSVQAIQTAPQLPATPQKPYDQMTREQLEAEKKRLMRELGVTGNPQPEPQKSIGEMPREELGVDEKRLRDEFGITDMSGEAQKWCRKAMEGDSEAILRYGVCVLDGNGVVKSYEKGAAWIWKAAYQGNARAQFVLGLLFQNGMGVKKSKTEAIYWYRKAAAQGNG